MSGPMSERAPDITVEADGRADSTTVLVAKVSLDRPVQRLARSLRRLCAETGRDVALLLGLPGAQRHHSAVRGAPASCRSVGG
jgi:predicted glycoside hydrolase/deacetylase ChbG (UPF0249 family)